MISAPMTDPAGATMTPRTLRSTPSRIARSSSPQEITEMQTKSPASVRKKRGGSQTASKKLGKSPLPASPVSLGSDVPIQARVKSTRDLLAKTLVKNLKRKGPLPEGAQAQSKKARRANPGVRVVGGKIYDSDNGLTCHQCRQKTLELTALCKGGHAKCKRGFCSKCLFNRYGEKAEEVSQLPAWPCPYCRGLCNCSYCRKKNGLQATGILAHVAKAQGFGSVAALLKTSPKAVQPPVSPRILKQTSPNSPAVGTGLQSPTRTTPTSSKRVKELIRSEEKPPSKERTQSGVREKGSNKRKSSKPSPAALPERTFFLPPHLEEVDGLPTPVTPGTKRLRAPGSGLTSDAQQRKEGSFKSGDGGKDVQGAVAARDAEVVIEKKRQKRKAKDLQEDARPLPRPSSCPLTELHGVAVPPELVGDTLQILEFLSVFAEVIDLPYYSESKLLRELFELDKLPRGERSAIGQVQDRLLYLLLEEREQAPRISSQWLAALHEYLNSHPLMHRLLDQPLVISFPDPESPKPLSAKRIRAEVVRDSESPPSAFRKSEADTEAKETEKKNSLDAGLLVLNGTKEAVRILEALSDGKASGGYTLLSPTDRVFLLKLLCDDALETAPVRAHMEASLGAAEKEARQQRKGGAAAKERVKDARAKLRELELTQLLGLKGERTPLSPGAQQQLVTSMGELASKLTDAIAAAKSAGKKCPEAVTVDCSAMRVLPLGSAVDNVHFWKLSAASDSLLSQVCLPCKVPTESWLQSDASEVEAFADTLKTSGVHGIRLETRLRTAFLQTGGQDV